MFSTGKFKMINCVMLSLNLLPQVALCTDNAAMIAWAGVMRLNGRDGRGDELDEPILKKWPIGSVF